MLNISPLGHHKMGADFLRTYKKMVKDTQFTERMSPGRILSLRPSQMPLCPMRLFVDRATHGIYQPMEFGMAYYTKVGTVVHEILQNFLCQSGKFLANYYCRECNTWHKMSHQWECCGFPCEYHEVEINFKGIVGHIDAIYRDDEGKYWILDFKTTSTEQAPKKQKDPGIVYREQVETYAVLTELQHGIKIEGYADSFLARNNPLKQDPVTWCEKLTDKKRKEVRIRLTRYKKMHKAYLDASSKKEVLALLDWGRCADPYCSVCKDPVDDDVKKKLLQAYTFGKARNNVPVRALAEREIERLKEIGYVHQGTNA